MRKDGKKYSLPTLHEMPSKQREKALLATPQLKETFSSPAAFRNGCEDPPLFENKARTRSGLIARRHSYAARILSTGSNFIFRSGSPSSEVLCCTFFM